MEDARDRTVEEAEFGVCVAGGALGGESCLPQIPPGQMANPGVVRFAQSIGPPAGPTKACGIWGRTDRRPGTGSLPCSQVSLGPHPRTPPLWLICLQIYLLSPPSPRTRPKPYALCISEGSDTRPRLPELRKPPLARQRGCGANQILQEGTVAHPPAYQRPRQADLLTTSNSQRRHEALRPTP